MRDSINSRGFAILPDVFRPDEILKFVDTLDDAPLRRSRAGVRHALGHPVVRQLAHDRRLLGLAQAVLGPAAFPFRVTLFDKSPQANWLVVWHQDTALPLLERRESPEWGPWSVKEGVVYAHAPASALNRILALRVHLDDSNADNGPLRVLPESHTLGVLSDEAIHHLAKSISPVDCLVPRGGVLAMRPLIVHSSSKSLTQARRRVLHIEFATSGDFGAGLNLAAA